MAKQHIIKTNNRLHEAILATFYAMIAGAFYRVMWERKLKTYKGTTATLTKVVVAYVKAGLNYDNMVSVQAKRASGELPSVNQGLPWGTWYDYPRVIVHNLVYYLRLYPANDFGRMSVEYRLDGKPIAEAQAKEYCLASEFAGRESLDCFTVKLDNLKSFDRVVTPTAPNWENSVEARLCRD